MRANPMHIRRAFKFKLINGVIQAVTSPDSD